MADKHLETIEFIDNMLVKVAAEIEKLCVERKSEEDEIRNRAYTNAASIVKYYNFLDELLTAFDDDYEGFDGDAFVKKLIENIVAELWEQGYKNLENGIELNINTYYSTAADVVRFYPTHQLLLEPLTGAYYKNDSEGRTIFYLG